LIFVATKDDADGRIALRSHDLLLEIIEVEIHLFRVPMAERPDLEIHQYVAAKELLAQNMGRNGSKIALRVISMSLFVPLI
jgi:hypothetical protein